MRLLVDAEHTYFQPAIDALTINMQQKYNKREPVVINTYQCYLKDSYHRLLTDMQVEQILPLSVIPSVPSFTQFCTSPQLLSSCLKV
jgi:Proline dehydrogenase